MMTTRITPAAINIPINHQLGPPPVPGVVGVVVVVDVGVVIGGVVVGGVVVGVAVGGVLVGGTVVGVGVGVAAGLGASTVK